MASWRNSTRRYGRVAQSFHWVVAAMVLMQVWIGIHVDDLPLGIERIKWMSRHKALGITILFVLLLRLAWRYFDRPPHLPSHLPRWQRRVAGIVHATLYSLLVAAPIAGWLAASAAGLGISWFGLFTIPALIDKAPDQVELFESVHESLVIVLALVILVHAAAAVWHAARHDHVMSRMLPSIFLPSSYMKERR